jgi:mannose-6-phosphate isomerase
MNWHPLRLTVPVRTHLFGGRAIAERFGRTGLPTGRVAETWEVSDVDGSQSRVLRGDLSGRALRSLIQEHPLEVMGAGWRGQSFPILTKFIDATGALPVHLHADDASAQRLEGERNGKTEAWHIVDAAPGATALCGVRPGVGRDALREALLAQDFDAVLRRIPVRSGQTVYVPGGTPHSFGPHTLVYEIEQTSDIQQHAMHHRMEDGAEIADDQWRANIDMLMREVDVDSRPEPAAGLTIPLADSVARTILCAGPYFALERWTAGTPQPIRRTFHTAQIVTNLGASITLEAGSRDDALGSGETVLIPAVVGHLRIEGPADVLFGYLPDLDRDIRRPLGEAGFAPPAWSDHVH